MGQTQQNARRPASPLNLRVRVGLSLLSGLLLFLSFPPADLSWLGWVAFVPLLAAVGTSGGYRSAALCGLVAAASAYLPSFAWVFSVHVLGWLALCLYVGLYLVAAAVLFRFLQVRFPVLWPLSAALLWTGLELFRARLGPGFPWLFLGYTQYQFGSLLQTAAWWGVHGLSFLLMLVNACLAALLLSAPARRRASLAALGTAVLLVGVCAAAGAGVRRSIQTREGPVVGVVQQNIPRVVSEVYDPDKTEEEAFRELEQEIETAVRLSERLVEEQPAMVVWPETTVQRPLNLAPELWLDPRLRSIMSDTMAHLRRLGRQMDTHLLVGARTNLPPSTGYLEEVPPGTRTDYLGNSAMLFSPRGRFVRRYDKMRRVPFGEYLPLREWLPFLQGLTPLVHELDAGREKVVFSLPTQDGASLRFAALICYEDVFPSLTRSFRLKGADFLVNLTDEGWYPIPGELGQHLAMAVFRAVETRTTVVRAANTGISCFIGPRGEVYERLQPYTRAAGAAPLRLSEELTFYMRHGDWFAVSCLSLSIGLPGLLLALRRGGSCGAAGHSPSTE